METATPENKTTLIVGSGGCAREIAAALAAAGIPVVMVSEAAEAGNAPDAVSGNGRIEFLAGTRLVGCRGRVGAFQVDLQCNGESLSRDAARLIIAEADRRAPRFDGYGLKPGASVVSLTELKNRLEGGKTLSATQRHVVFLTGLGVESDPVIAGDVMNAALAVQQEPGIQTYVLCGNLKVAADGLERLYRRTREAGTFYAKFAASRPEVRQTTDGAVAIAFDDPVTARRFSLKPDLVVVDEVILPNDRLAQLARVLGLQMDADGFAQADNVHRWAVATNRPGIYCAGPARAALSTEAQRVEAAAAVLRVLAGHPAPAMEPAEINSGRCVRCLTCFRLCPYRAIRIVGNRRVEVMPEACMRCGICAAECPGEAIRIPGLEKDVLGAAAVFTEGASPRITAFCCERSAVQAGRLARCMGQPLPSGLQVVGVPCAGSVSLQHVMAAFERGADGVMILSCHDGNCHSEQGTRMVAKRTGYLSGFFAHLGLETGRLKRHTLAANMGRGFADALADFERELKALGPTRLAL